MFQSKKFQFSLIYSLFTHITASLSIKVVLQRTFLFQLTNDLCRSFTKSVIILLLSKAVFIKRTLLFQYFVLKIEPSFRMVPVWMTFSDLFKVMIIQHQMTSKWYNIQLYLQWPTNRKSYMIYRTAPFSMTLNDLYPQFPGHAIIWHWISQKCYGIQK